MEETSKMGVSGLRLDGGKDWRPAVSRWEQQLCLLRAGAPACCMPLPQHLKPRKRSGGPGQPGPQNEPSTSLCSHPHKSKQTSAFTSCVRTKTCWFRCEGATQASPHPFILCMEGMQVLRSGVNSHHVGPGNSTGSSSECLYQPN